MTLFKKIFDLFGRNTESNSGKDYQAQFKTTITAIDMNTSHNTENSPTPSGTFDVIVVGVSFYQTALEKICGNKHEQGVALFTQANIVPYNDNPHDANAVRVEIDGETVGHLSRKNASIWRSKMISDNLSGAIKCPAKIVWDRSAHKEGSYGVWVDLDLTLSDSKPEIAQTASVAGNQSDQIEFFVNKLNRFELSHCKVGDDVNLWVAEETGEIFIYRQEADFGEGKIGVCPDEVFKTIQNAPGCDAKIVSIYEMGCKISCRLISKAEMAERLKPFTAAEKKRRQDLRRDLTTPVEYSAIDEDIYKCFVSNKTGMCDNIGTWEQFQKVEEQIANKCREKKGKYYRSPAKTAQFAIIFDPGARTLSNVTRLKKMGYKVTTFEKALEYFALTDFWDCKKLSHYEHECKKLDYEITFGKPFPLSKEQK